VAIGVGLLLLLVYAVATSWAFGRSLVRTIQQLQLETELMATVHPDHRLDIKTGDELEILAREINQLADSMRGARHGLEQQVWTATQALDAEREKLADVLESLSEAVVLLASDGRVTLANRAARDLLGPAPLGRSVFELADKERLEPCFERLRTASSQLENLSVDSFEAVAAPFHDTAQRVVGFTLVVRSAPPLERPRFVGMGTRSGWHGDPAASDRPDLYDFSLLDAMERAVDVVDRAQRLSALTFVAFDVETTGLHPEAEDRIVSLAGVKVRPSGRQEQFDALINPRRRIPPVSTTLHGITDDMVAEAPPIEDVLPAFVDFAQDCVLVGHQVSFDLRFLDRDARRLGLPALTATHAVLDTLLLSAVVHGPLSEHGLDSVTARLGVSVEGRHSALGDALATAEVLRRLLELLAKRDIQTLGQALDAAHAAEPGLLASLRDA